MNECNGMERNGTETGREGRRGREIISILSGKKERNGWRRFMKKCFPNCPSPLPVPLRSVPLVQHLNIFHFDNENIAISLASHYFPVSRSAPLRAIFFISVTLANVPWTCLPSPFRSISIPLRSVLRWCRIRQLNIVKCSLDLSSISVPLRSALRWCKATKHCKIEIKNVRRSGAEHFWMGTPLENCNFSSHSIFPMSAPLRATIIPGPFFHLCSAPLRVTLM